MLHLGKFAQDVPNWIVKDGGLIFHIHIRVIFQDISDRIRAWSRIEETARLGGVNGVQHTNGRHVCRQKRVERRSNRVRAGSDGLACGKNPVIDGNEERESGSARIVWVAGVIVNVKLNRVDDVTRRFDQAAYLAIVACNNVVIGIDSIDVAPHVVSRECWGLGRIGDKEEFYAGKRVPDGDPVLLQAFGAGKEGLL